MRERVAVAAMKENRWLVRTG